MNKRNIETIIWGFTILSITFSTTSAFGGLNIFLDDADTISTKKMTEATYNSGKFIFRYPLKTLEIELSKKNALEIIKWSERDLGGPVILSQEGSLVPSMTKSYYPKSLTLEFAKSLLWLDSEGHSLICGARPKRCRFTQTDVEMITLPSHPLIKKNDDSKMPDAIIDTLLNLNNPSQEALSYRYLATRYANIPGCIGELSLYVRQGKTPGTLQTSVKTWIHPGMSVWYRQREVPSEETRWIARLPYQPLKNDIENRWSEYRKAIPSMELLSSIAEAMAMIRKLRRERPGLFAKLKESVDGADKSNEDPDMKNRVCLRNSYPRSSQIWKKISVQWIGKTIETPEEANLAISIMREKDGFFKYKWLEDVRSYTIEFSEEVDANTILIPAFKYKWLDDIRRVAISDERTALKYELHNQLAFFETDALKKQQQVRNFFSKLKTGNGRFFRLRAHALNLLREEWINTRKKWIKERENRITRIGHSSHSDNSDGDDYYSSEAGDYDTEDGMNKEIGQIREDTQWLINQALLELEARESTAISQKDLDEFDQLLNAEQDELLRDFYKRVSTQCNKRRGTPLDVEMWESLSQDVYSVGLLKWAEVNTFGDFNLSDEMVEAVSCIHYRRALASSQQKAREFMFQHSHFRYLNYLAEMTTNDDLKQRILSYRRDIAQIIDMPLYEEIYAKSSNDQPDKALGFEKLEGKLLSSKCLFNPSHKNACNSQKLLLDGNIGGIMTDKGFFVLLVDGTILGKALSRFCPTESAFRAFGVIHPKSHTMNPVRLEKKCGNGWTALDLPFSRSISGNSFAGDE